MGTCASAGPIRVAAARAPTLRPGGRASGAMPMPLQGPRCAPSSSPTGSKAGLALRPSSVESRANSLNRPPFPGPAS